MKKIFGIQAELNITADEDIVRGVSKGISKGSNILSEIIKEIKPEIINGIKKFFTEKESK